MTCKDCIHFKGVCEGHGLYFEDEYIKNVAFSEDVKDLCPDFKNKADFEEVKHGEWIDKFEKVTTLGGNGIERKFLCGYKCSLCGRTEIKKEPYCNCGAKMDGAKEGELI